MNCPKCEIGRIVHVILKMSGEEASLCDYCNTLWVEGEDINASSVITLDIAKASGDVEFTLEESEEEDQDHRSANYPTYK